MKTIFSQPHLFNRAGAESGATHLIVPAGEWPGVLRSPGGEARAVTQVVDEEAMEAIMNAFSGELLIDYEHFSHDPEKETVAAGWIHGLVRKPDGIHMRTNWSGRGKADLDQKNYRYISPEFSGEALQDIGEGRVRPLALTGAGLTNRPNLPMPPLTNRGPGRSTNNHTTENMDNIKKALGLEAGATEEQVLDKITGLQKDHATLRNRADGLDKEVENLRGQLVESDLAAHADVITDKEAARDMLLTNRDGTLKLLASLRKAEGGGAKPEEGKKSPAGETLLNRKPPEQPAGSPGGEDAKREAEEKRAGQLHNRATEIARTEKISFAAAWQRAEREIPNCLP